MVDSFSSDNNALFERSSGGGGHEKVHKNRAGHTWTNSEMGKAEADLDKVMRNVNKPRKGHEEESFGQRFRKEWNDFKDDVREAFGRETSSQVIDSRDIRQPKQSRGVDHTDEEREDRAEKKSKARFGERSSWGEHNSESHSRGNHHQPEISEGLVSKLKNALSGGTPSDHNDRWDSNSHGQSNSHSSHRGGGGGRAGHAK